MEKDFEKVATFEDTEFLLKCRNRYKGVPTVIVTTAEMREACLQREIEGILNDDNHAPLVLQLSGHRFLTNRNNVREAIEGGKSPFIVARMKKFTVPLYYKTRGWTFNIEEAIRFNTVEQLEYWASKLGKKHVKHDLVDFILPAIEGEPVVLAKDGED